MDKYKVYYSKLEINFFTFWMNWEIAYCDGCMLQKRIHLDNAFHAVNMLLLQ